MRICEYGCGQEAKYPPRKGKTKWSCENTTNKCPEIKRKNIEKNKGRLPWNTGMKNGENIICSVCGKELYRSKAYIESLKYIKNPTCSVECRKIANKRKRGPNKKKTNPTKVSMINTNNLCEYGCNQSANYKLEFISGDKFCCSSHFLKCPENKRNKNYKKENHPNFGKSHSISTKKKISNQIKYIILTDEEYNKNQSISKRITIRQIKQKYLTFSKIEEMRYNPDKPEEKEIQVHCKYHECKNSKEQDGWFTPTNIYERIRQLESTNGNEASYFYCSDKCKQLCPLYNKTVSQLIKLDQIKAGIIKEEYYTSSENKIYNKEVLKRADNLCEYCGQPAEHVHHMRPQKLDPFFSLDPDYGVACCSKCHYKYGHETGTECSTGNLASEVCNG